jgi:ribosomal subunit interface protein
MRIEIRGRNLELTDVLRAHVERRLGLALGRFAARIGRVTVRLTGDRGADKHCAIEVALRPTSVKVEDTDADPFAAVDHAARRVSRTIARALERERELNGTA